MLKTAGKFGFGLVILLSSFVEYEALAEQKSTGNPNTIQLQIPEQKDPSPLWLKVLDDLSWPLVVIGAIILLRKPVSKLIEALGQPGVNIEIAGFAVRLPALETKVATQQGQLEIQNDKIKQLITFSMSWYIYEMLYALNSEKKKVGGSYIYKVNGSMTRNLRFLIDHGYIQEIYEWPNDNEDVLPQFWITRAGVAILAMRGLPGTSDDQRPSLDGEV